MRSTSTAVAQHSAAHPTSGVRCGTRCRALGARGLHLAARHSATHSRASLALSKHSAPARCPNSWAHAVHPLCCAHVPHARSLASGAVLERLSRAMPSPIPNCAARRSSMDENVKTTFIPSIIPFEAVKFVVIRLVGREGNIKSPTLEVVLGNVCFHEMPWNPPVRIQIRRQLNGCPTSLLA